MVNMKSSLLSSVPLVAIAPMAATNGQQVAPASLDPLASSATGMEVTPTLLNRSFTLGHSPMIYIPSASLPNADGLFTPGHDLAIQTKPTAAATQQDEIRPLTLGHGPVAISTQTPMPSFTVERRHLTLVHNPAEVSIPQPAASLLKKQRLFTIGHGPATVPTQTPAASLWGLEYPFALGHGPVVSSKQISSSLFIEEHLFKLQHSPMTVPTSTRSLNTRENHVESIVPVAPSTLATVGKLSTPTKIIHTFRTPLPKNYSVPGVKSGPKSTVIDPDSERWSKARQWLKSWAGWRTDYNNQSDDDVTGIKLNYIMPGDQKPNVYTKTRSNKTVEIISKFIDYALTDCHPDSSEYVYFTVLSPDGELARDSKRERMLLYVKTEWSLTYPETLRKALLNDAEVFPGCPNGHCISKLIPGTDLRLEYVKNPHVFRANWQDGHCGYLDIQKINRMAVRLGAFGYLYKGSAPHIRVVDFVEQQMLTTYPKLEIGLICGSTVGLISGIYLLYLLYVGSLCSWGESYTICRAIADGTKKCVAKARNAEWNKLGGSSKYHGSTQDEFAEDCPLRPNSPHPYSLSLVTPPPAYTSVELPRVFREVEELRERPLETCMRDGMVTIV